MVESRRRKIARGVEPRLEYVLKCSRLIQGGNTGMRVEDLFQQGGAASEMAAEKGQSGRFRPGVRWRFLRPPSKNIFGEGSGELAKVVGILIVPLQ
jgi:hypothetical protein